MRRSTGRAVDCSAGWGNGDDEYNIFVMLYDVVSWVERLGY
jgi:hypothetical protein